MSRREAPSEELLQHVHVAGGGKGEQEPGTKTNQSTIRPAVRRRGRREELPLLYMHTHLLCCGLLLCGSSRGAHSLVEDFAVESLLLHVGLPRPSVLLVGEGNCVSKPAPAAKEDTKQLGKVGKT